MSQLERVLARHLDSPEVAVFGATAGIWAGGRELDVAARGSALAYRVVDDTPELLQEADREPVTLETRFDVASLTKLFTATLAMTLVDDGTIALSTPVGSVLPEFGSGERRRVTVRDLLAHTSGLREDYPLWQVSSDDRLRTVLTLPLEAAPGAGFRYSCLGYVTAGALMERVTGISLRELIETRVLHPLMLADTGFGPYDNTDSIAATEYQPWTGRGILRGDVHDETAWGLGGAAGNAGLFSTLRDLARFGELFHGAGVVDGRRILSPEAVATMTEPGVRADAEQFDQGIGFRIDAQQFMGGLASGGIGHTGFTGTSIVIHLDRGVTAVLLSNRVHPSRQGFDSSAMRRDVADEALRAVAAAT